MEEDEEEEDGLFEEEEEEGIGVDEVRRVGGWVGG